MDVVSEIEVLETDVKDCNEKCKRVNCTAIYEAIISSLKFLYRFLLIRNMEWFKEFINKI